MCIKRFMAKATALALVMLAAMLPAQVFAADDPEYQNLWPGQIVTAASSVAASTSGGWSYLDNGFIRFGIRLNSTGTGVNILTLPSILKDQAAAFSSNSVFQQSSWLFTAYSNGNIKTRPATPSSAAIQRNADNIRVVYTFTGTDRSGASYSFIETLIFSLVKLDDADGHSNNYGVQVQRISSETIIDVGLGEDVGSFGWAINFVNFHKMGHINANRADVAVQTLNRDNDGNATYTTISKGLGYTNTSGTPAITQVVNNSFNWANPFVFLSWLHGKNNNTDLDKDPYPCSDAVEYNIPTANAALLKAYHNNAGGYALWGFRDLVDAGDGVNPPDIITVSNTATRLGIFKSGSGYAAESAADEAQLAELKKRYGTPVAVLRGDLIKQGNSFVFTEESAMLSPTVSATWDEGAGGELSVSSSGV